MKQAKALSVLLFVSFYQTTFAAAPQSTREKLFTGHDPYQVDYRNPKNMVVSEFILSILEPAIIVGTFAYLAEKKSTATAISAGAVILTYGSWMAKQEYDTFQESSPAKITEEITKDWQAATTRLTQPTTLRDTEAIPLVKGHLTTQSMQREYALHQSKSKNRTPLFTAKLHERIQELDKNLDTTLDQFCTRYDTEQAQRAAYK